LFPNAEWWPTCWLRPGDSYTTNNFVGFLEDSLSKLPGKKVGLIRADSGFYSKELLEYLKNGHQTPINYIVAFKFYCPIQLKLATHKTWMKLG